MDYTPILRNLRNLAGGGGSDTRSVSMIHYIQPVYEANEDGIQREIGLSTFEEPGRGGDKGWNRLRKLFGGTAKTKVRHLYPNIAPAAEQSLVMRLALGSIHAMSLQYAKAGVKIPPEVKLAVFQFYRVAWRRYQSDSEVRSLVEELYPAFQQRLPEDEQTSVDQLPELYH